MSNGKKMWTRALLIQLVLQVTLQSNADGNISVQFGAIPLEPTPHTAQKSFRSITTRAEVSADALLKKGRSTRAHVHSSSVNSAESPSFERVADSADTIELLKNGGNTQAYTHFYSESSTAESRGITNGFTQMAGSTEGNDVSRGVTNSFAQVTGSADTMKNGSSTRAYTHSPSACFTQPGFHTARVTRGFAQVTSSVEADECFPPVKILTQLEGRLDWDSRTLLRIRCTSNAFRVAWNITLPSAFAVTVKIGRIVPDPPGVTLELHGLPPRTDLSSKTLLRTYPTDVGKFGLSPILSDASSMVIIAALSYSSPIPALLFDIDWFPHPLDEMPVFQDPPFETDSRVKYACRDNIPRVLKCDMIEQCVGGEDERNCSYKGDGSCGDWIPYNAEYCIKPFFHNVMAYDFGKPWPLHPAKAQEACLKYHGAFLANPTDGMKLVADIVHNSGFLTATLGLKKMKPVSPKLGHMYRFLWQWGDRGSPVAYSQQLVAKKGMLLDCVMLSVYYRVTLVPVKCSWPEKLPSGHVCMRAKPFRQSLEPEGVLKLDFHESGEEIRRFPAKRCSDGSLVHTFLTCPGAFELPGNAWSPASLPLFHCGSGHFIHYTLVCDGKSDCTDGSDEVRCERPRLVPLLESSFVCGGSQTVPASLQCNGMADCFDATDEDDCGTCKPGFVLCPDLGCAPWSVASFVATCPLGLATPFAIPRFRLPASLRLDGYGMYSLNSTPECLDKEFRCASGLCIPTFLIKNGEKDCPRGEDENIYIDMLTCFGYYRCQDVGTCVHIDYVCDGIHHCPNKDDERFCDLICPEYCSCEGYAYTCSQMFDPFQHLQVRYLDLSLIPHPPLGDVNIMEYLHFLNLSFCQLKNISLEGMPSLLVLDLSFNDFYGLHAFRLEKLLGLIALNLSGNPLVWELSVSSLSALLPSSATKSLQKLIVTHTNVSSIEGRALGLLSRLQVLDLRGNRVAQFDKDIFWGLNKLQSLYTDNFVLCCPYFNFPQAECHAPEDELSSCSDLLRSEFFRVTLWSFSVLAIAGNVCSLAFRLCSQNQRRTQQTSRVLLSNLGAADLLMGVYMLVIGSADAFFSGMYVSNESMWRQSGVCKMAGFLGFVSSEVSGFVICLVTLDRFLVLCFPLKSEFHMTARSAVLASGAAWLVGVSLAAVPLMAQWEFYGQSGICLPLPITRKRYNAQAYAFGVFIVLNFVFFLLIGAGQVFIFQSVRRRELSTLGTDRRHQETTIARRLFLIALTDFLCWFPICLMGLLANQGFPMPGEVNVWAAIFMLPMNSVLNPFLYTLNGIVERWRRRREAARLMKLIRKLHSEIPKWTPATVEELTLICIRSKLVQKDRILQLLGVASRKSD